MGSNTKPIRNDLSISEELSRAINEMGNMELIELRQTSATIQCPSCLKHVPEGLNMVNAASGFDPIKVRWAESEKHLQRQKAPYNLASKIISRGKQSGHNPWQQDLKKSHGCKTRSIETRQIHLYTGPMAE